jgi:hypothetical protein
MAPREDLQREIGRLEGRLSSARVVEELSKVRTGLDGGGQYKPGFDLPNLRIGFKCKQRWEDMTGDDRVRACNGCERPVFNLSEMTREEAEAVLATRGLTPCVRFYRRPDGTVMTSDCPTGTRPRVRLAVVASSFAAGTTLLATPIAHAEEPAKWEAAPPPGSTDGPTDTPSDATDTTDDDPSDPATGTTIDVNDDVTMGVPVDDGQWLMGDIAEYPEDYKRPPVEWSAWGRLGLGASSKPDGDLAARQLTPPTMDPHTPTYLEAAAGADLTLGMALHGKLRVGAFGEIRTSSSPVMGAELVLEHLPPNPYGRWADGAQLVIRAGAGFHVITGAIGVGYVGAWPRRDPWVSWARHVVGARLLVSMNRSTEDPRDWSATIGLEVDPTALVHAILDVATEH